MKRAFTMAELLVVMLVLSILAGLLAVALAAAINDARASRTVTIIAKVDSFIADRWEHYRTRSVSLRLPPGITPIDAARSRLYALRELQRIELPDRISDLCTDSELADLAVDSKLDAIDWGAVKLVMLTTASSVTRSYKRQAERSIEGATPRPWSTEYQGSECLYLILSTIQDGDKAALGYFQESEIGDVDGDGMREILDGWGRPLEFIRWPSGYTIQNLAVTDQTADLKAPDPFDPLKVDGADTYAIHPLIYSAGLDGQYDVNRGDVVYSWPDYPTFPSQVQANDPYYVASPLIGTPADTNGDGTISADNITNHNHND